MINVFSFYNKFFGKISLDTLQQQQQQQKQQLQQQQQQYISVQLCSIYLIYLICFMFMPGQTKKESHYKVHFKHL